MQALKELREKAGLTQREAVRALMGYDPGPRYGDSEVATE